MKLHADAALSSKKRCLLLGDRVIEQQWTLTQATEVADADGMPALLLVPTAASRREAV